MTIDSSVSGHHAVSLGLAPDRFPAFVLEEPVSRQTVPFDQSREIVSEEIEALIRGSGFLEGNGNGGVDRVVEEQVAVGGGKGESVLPSVRGDDDDEKKKGEVVVVVVEEEEEAEMMVVVEEEEEEEAKMVSSVCLFTYSTHALHTREAI
jgi:hypothetical protein